MSLGKLLLIAGVIILLGVASRFTGDRASLSWTSGTANAAAPKPVQAALAQEH
jgi:hypothetical protein